MDCLLCQSNTGTRDYQSMTESHWQLLTLAFSSNPIFDQDFQTFKLCSSCINSLENLQLLKELSDEEGFFDELTNLQNLFIASLEKSLSVHTRVRMRLLKEVFNDRNKVVNFDYGEYPGSSNRFLHRTVLRQIEANPTNLRAILSRNDNVEIINEVEAPHQLEIDGPNENSFTNTHHNLFHINFNNFHCQEPTRDNSQLALQNGSILNFDLDRGSLPDNSSRNPEYEEGVPIITNIRTVGGNTYEFVPYNSNYSDPDVIINPVEELNRFNSLQTKNDKLVDFHKFNNPVVCLKCSNKPVFITEEALQKHTRKHHPQISATNKCPSKSITGNHKVADSTNLIKTNTLAKSNLDPTVTVRDMANKSPGHDKNSQSMSTSNKILTINHSSKSTNVQDERNLRIDAEKPPICPRPIHVARKKSKASTSPKTVDITRRITRNLKQSHQRTPTLPIINSRCRSCRKFFYSKVELTNHQCEKEWKFKGSICLDIVTANSQAFSSQSSDVNKPDNRNISTGILPTPGANEPTSLRKCSNGSKEKTLGDRLPCGFCEKSFIRKMTLDTHIRKYHTKETETLEKQKGKEKIEKYSSKLTTKTLKTHNELSRSRAFVCHCTEVFDSEGQYILHRYLVHKENI